MIQRNPDEENGRLYFKMCESLEPPYGKQSMMAGYIDMPIIGGLTGCVSQTQFFISTHIEQSYTPN